MIKAKDIQIFSHRIAFAAQQLFGLDQEPVAFGLFFARVRNRIGFKHYFAPVLLEPPDQQSAAFIWIISLAVLADFC